MFDRISAIVRNARERLGPAMQRGDLEAKAEAARLSLATTVLHRNSIRQQLAALRRRSHRDVPTEAVLTAEMAIDQSQIERLRVGLDDTLSRMAALDTARRTTDEADPPVSPKPGA